MPWNQGPITFDANPSRSRDLLGTQPNLQPPQTLSNTSAQPMDVDLEDVGIDFGMDLGGDWNMDEYLNNEYILRCQITE